MRWYASLRRTGDFARVRRRGRRTGLRTLAAYTLAATSRRTRVGIVAGKGVGGAVVRNLARRRVRGALDALTEEPDRTSGYDLVLILTPQAATEGYAQIAADVRAVLARLGAG